MSMFRSSRRQTAPDFDLLVPETRTRRIEKRFFDQEVVDADFIDVKDAISRPHGNDNQGRAAPTRKAPIYGDMKTFSALISKVERYLSRLTIDGFAAVIAASIICVFVLSGGFSLFSSDEAIAAKPFNPLGISYVNITPQYVSGHDVLVISGVIENHGTSALEVPQILASLSAGRGEFVASMIIQPPISQIKPGNSHGFSAKLRHPGGKTPEIKLSFMQTDVSAR